MSLVNNVFPRPDAACADTSRRGAESLPGEDRLLQLGHTGDATRKNFAELIDQCGGWRVNKVAEMAVADQAPVALGNGNEIEPCGRAICDSAMR
jgi:hypothetical protein